MKFSNFSVFNVAMMVSHVALWQGVTVAGLNVGKTILYENDFEQPRKPIGQTSRGCNYNGANARYVNTLYQKQGGPNHTPTKFGSGMFGQVNTAETVTLTDQYWDGNSNNDPYVNIVPEGVNVGNHAIGMQYYNSDSWDIVYLDFEAPEEQEYFNVELDVTEFTLSSRCEPDDPRVPYAPKFRMTLFQDDDRDGTKPFDATQANKGTINDNWEKVQSHEMVGIKPANNTAITWAHRTVTFRKKHHRVLRIMIEPIEGYYHGFDNLEIYTTVTAPPTPFPSQAPSSSPSQSPSTSPSSGPSSSPSKSPSGSPSVSPSSKPSGSPSASPSRSPSVAPSGSPSGVPSSSPSSGPSASPSKSPSGSPSASPSSNPSGSPSASPSQSPSVAPSGSPSGIPSSSPSSAPTPKSTSTKQVTTKTPSKKGSSSGDPHFKTWTGDKYDFHGECDLVLVDNPTFADGMGLKVHIRTTRVKYFSFIEKVALQIGSDVLEFDNDVENFMINGAKVEAQRKHHKTMLGPYMIRRDPKAISVRLADGTGPHKKTGAAKIDFIQRKNGFPAVIVDGGSTDIFRGSLGLLGEWETGKKMARDGTTELVVNGVTDEAGATAFALEWQVRDDEPMLFQESDRYPQYPTQCLPPASSSGTGKRLGSDMARKEAEEACSHWTEDIDDCVFDVLATRNPLVAEEGHIGVHVE